ncbi:20542_t:CDS:1, partial [Gigaspora rosea]
RLRQLSDSPGGRPEVILPLQIKTFQQFGGPRTRSLMHFTKR